MPDLTTLGLYFSAAFVLAITPGPGILYVLTRSLKGGRAEGYASSFGTAIGGMFHVLAAALGLSAILMTSATLFTVVKFAGAAYLIYMGVNTILSPDITLDDIDAPPPQGNALWQGIITEVLNPKTALFFLAFIPQFVNPEAALFSQFVVLGTLSVVLNTTADVVVATLAGPIGARMKRQAGLRRGQRWFTGSALVGLGVFVAVTGEGTE